MEPPSAPSALERMMFLISIISTPLNICKRSRELRFPGLMSAKAGPVRVCDDQQSEPKEIINVF
jgi:hypothetical protein